MNTVHKSAGIVCVPGSNGKKIIATLEYSRVAIIEDYFAAHVLETIDKFDDGIENALNHHPDHTNTALHDSGTSKHTIAINATFYVINCETLEISAVASTKSESESLDTSISNTAPNTAAISVSTGDSIEVYWNLTDQSYPVTMESIT